MRHNNNNNNDGDGDNNDDDNNNDDDDNDDDDDNNNNNNNTVWGHPSDPVVGVLVWCEQCQRPTTVKVKNCDMKSISIGVSSSSNKSGIQNCPHSFCVLSLIFFQWQV